MLKPGDTAPPFDLACAIDSKIGRLRLGQIKSGLIVLFFYPRDFSFICPTEVIGFHKARVDFETENAAIVGVSVDDAQSHLKWAVELGGVSYPLMADIGGKIAAAYGVLDERECVALRATFIIDAKRQIAYSVASRANVGRSVSETLRVVRALRSGRMCPSDWQPGQSFGPDQQKY